MKKIHTIFKRDWENGGKINSELDVNFDFANSVATEKIDGTNVRVTIRNGTCVRLEKRRNPDKVQKHKGIEEPWYTDATDGDPQDKWIFDALRNTDLTTLPDGEWSAEAFGKNIQGNPLKMDKNQLLFFSLGQAPVFENVPTTYEGLRGWLSKTKSKINPEAGIEGIVWHATNGDMVKIKLKDFYDKRN